MSDSSPARRSVLPCVQQCHRSVMNLLCIVDHMSTKSMTLQGSSPVHDNRVCYAVGPEEPATRGLDSLRAVSNRPHAAVCVHENWRCILHFCFSVLSYELRERGICTSFFKKNIDSMSVCNLILSATQALNTHWCPRDFTYVPTTGCFLARSAKNCTEE